MKYLLDTCAFIWMITSDEEKLSKRAKEIFINLENELYVSIISRFEISIKRNICKLVELEKETEYYFENIRKLQGIRMLPLQGEDIDIMEKLPLLHKDPFDRIIISKAINNGLTIISNDDIFKQYPVKTIW
jgi:PIN domain nuclease of toxin-antitoxin system